MKKIFNPIYLPLICLLAIMGCTKKYQEFNTNPNNSSHATPETLLAPALYSVVNANLSRALKLNNEMMQVHVAISSLDEIHRYIIRPSESDYMWNRWYIQRTNFMAMYDAAKKINHDGYMGMSLILDAWVSSQLTDMFGSVPYTQANKGRDTVYQPVFDEQPIIYTDLFRKLEEANKLLGAKDTILANDKVLDPLYNGDINKWRKFGNSLYLRLLLRVSGRPEINAGEKIKEIVETKKAEYPIFTTNNESAILRFTQIPPYVSAFFNYTDVEFNMDGLCEYFIDNLRIWNDPRLPLWSTTYGGEYAGIPSGYLPGQVPPRKSQYRATLKNDPLLGNIMNYAELQFILAEAALKGYIGTNAQTYYEEGVKAGITMWGATMPSTYFNNDHVKWSTAVTDDARMEMLHKQKYYSLFFTDFQQWHEFKRTGHPILPKGPGLQNGGIMPSRFKYPVYVQSLNQGNYQKAVEQQGADDLNTKVWWNKQ